jgi:hypothetical protein
MGSPYRTGLLDLLGLTEEERQRAIAWVNTAPRANIPDLAGTTGEPEIDHAQPGARRRPNDNGNPR